MKHVQPQGLGRRRAEQLLSQTKPFRTAGRRVDVLSRQFLGVPYRNTLIGSPQRAEVFTASLNGFDCVTYIETILALARAANVDQFITWLRRIRYKNANVAWECRNHYMTAWIQNSRGIGMLRHTRFPGIAGKMITRERTLDCVEGLPPVKARFKCVPKPVLRKLMPDLQTGDVIFFGSTRKHLDVFHCGILVRSGEHVMMRHAARSQGKVVEEKLDDFLKANRMAGVMVVRP